jgi:hypothetical protein
MTLMLKLTLKLAALSVVLLASGCGTPPSKLSAPKLITKLELREPFVYFGGAGNGSVRVEISIAAGTYLATYADDAGVYHKGPLQCYKVKVLERGWVYAADSVGKNAVSVDCGIYVSNDAAIAPKLYQVLGTDTGFFAPTAPAAAPTGDAAGVVMSTQPHLAGASPMAAGVGSAVAAGVIEAASAIERGNIVIMELPADREAFRKAIRFTAPSTGG